MHDGLDGLDCSCRICKAHPIFKLACMVDADTVAIGHVSGIHQIDPVLHEMITFSILGHRLCESSTL